MPEIMQRFLFQTLELGASCFCFCHCYCHCWRCCGTLSALYAPKTNNKCSNTNNNDK